MSIREALVAARTALEIITKVCSDQTVKLVAESALETVRRECDGPETPPRSSGARRQARYRENLKKRNGDASPVTSQSVTGDVVSPAPSSEDLKSCEETHREEESARGETQPVTSVTAFIDSTVQAMRNTGPFVDATDMHDGIQLLLARMGWTMRREVGVRDRGDGRFGKLDLVASRKIVTSDVTGSVTRDVVVALELDNVTPRGGSLLKLKATQADYRFVVLRNGGAELEIDGIPVICVRSSPFADEERSGQRKARNATDDGAFGLAVSAWGDGIREATGRPFTAPVAGALRHLVDAINEHRADAEPVAWARETAQEFVAANPGGTYDVFRFVNWLNSGRPRNSGPRLRSAPHVQPVPAGGSAWKAGQ